MEPLRCKVCEMNMDYDSRPQRRSLSWGDHSKNVSSYADDDGYTCCGYRKLFIEEYGALSDVDRASCQKKFLHFLEKQRPHYNLENVRKRAPLQKRFKDFIKEQGENLK